MAHDVKMMSPRRQVNHVPILLSHPREIAENIYPKGDGNMAGKERAGAGEF
jgi:hypothetical protein